jgi:exodeoxyribonuclease-3
VRIVTWNVNSVGARLPRVLELLEKHAPDVVLLQETKCNDDAFPAEALAEAGYASAPFGLGRWAGVAILARADGPPITDVVTGLPEAGWVGSTSSDEARWIEATVGDVRVASVYVINGRDLESPFFADKLRFLEAMAARAHELGKSGKSGIPLIVGGDVNVCPTDEDVYDPAAFVGATHVTPDERERLAEVLQAGDLVDAFRVLHPDGPGYTWWDYRQGHFHRGLGLRIDLLMVAEALAGGVTACGIDRDLRKGTKPSDHAPLLADLTVAAVRPDA